MLLVSFVGAIFPLIGRRWAHRPAVSLCFKLLAFAGTGVILAAAFIHLLSHANEYLTSPCLPESWLDAYHPGFAFLFCLAAIMFMMVIDYYVDAIFGEHAGHGENALAFADRSESSWDEIRVSPSTDAGTKNSDASSESDQERGEVYQRSSDDKLDKRAHHASVSIKALVTSQASIAVHSVIIGLALGTTAKQEFVSLLIAILFHQLLEGLAIGAITVSTRLSTRAVVLMALFYSLTTPIGIAIGIGVRESMNPNSQVSLLSQGIFDAIAAGLLIYVALGDHVNAIKCYGSWLKSQSWSVVALCMGAFLAGGAGISVLGVWD